MIKKDTSALVSNKYWDQTKSILLANSGVNKNPILSASLARVLDNTRKAIISETLMQSNVYLPKIVLSLVTKMFPLLSANKLVGVQPMEGSTGWIRFLDAYIEDTDPVTGKTTRSNIYPWANGKSMNYSTPYENNDANNRYTIAVNTPGVSPQAGLIADPATPTVPMRWSEGTLFIEEKTSTAPDVWTRRATVDHNGNVVEIDHYNKVIAPGATGEKNIIGFFDPKTSKYVLNFNSAPAGDIRIVWSRDMQKNIPFDIFDSTGARIHKRTYRTMKFDITKINLEAKSRKLGATYSFEQAEDFKNEFGEDFETRMVDYLTRTILTEIDMEVLSDLYNGAKHTATWDSRMPATWTKGLNDWYATILPVVNGMSNTIRQSTHVSGAKWLMCSHKTATIFQGLMQYSAKPVGETDLEIATVNVGSLNGHLDVYTSPLVPDNKILVGFKGNKPEDTGYVYAPYVPVMLHPISYAEGMPSLLARTRYATAMVRPDYYGIIEVED